jgi:hypothetical protein
MPSQFRFLAHRMRTYKGLFKCSLGLFLILFVVTMSPVSSFFQIKPPMAAALTGVSIHPTSNTINERGTYDIFLTTATDGMIKKIVMTFPSSFDLTSANKLIERNGIDPGSISFLGSTLTYTVTNAVSVGTEKIIRLEIASITPRAAGNFTVSIKTLDSTGATIEGPNPSSVFTIKSITGNDISTGFMIKKTLWNGANGWVPNGNLRDFMIQDRELAGASEDSVLISANVDGFLEVCSVGEISTTGSGFFKVNCNPGPPAIAQLHYVIFKLPPHVVTSSLNSSAP